MEYSNFEVQFTKSRTGYQAMVVNSPVGQASEECELPFGKQEMEDFLSAFERIQLGESALAQSGWELVKTFGKKLFSAVFHGEIGRALSRSLDKGNLRIWLRLKETPELALLPWEYLCDDQDRFFGLLKKTPIVRYLEMPFAPEPLTVHLPLRALAVISNPSNDPDIFPPLDVEQEWSKLCEALGELQDRGAVEIERLERATYESLQKSLRNWKPHILHFIGHGSFNEKAQHGALIFENEQGRGVEVSGEALGHLLHNADHVRMVVLNTCDGARASYHNAVAGVAQRLVQHDVPAVVAMQFKVSDAAAKVFAHVFYQALAEGRPLEEVLCEARIAMQGGKENNIEWGIPVLYLRAESGRIFNPKQANVIFKEDKDTSEVDWESLVSRLNDGNIIPILGPRMTQGLLPSAEEIAESWAQEYQYPFKMRGDLPRVAQFLETIKEQNIPHDWLVSKVFKNALLSRLENQSPESSQHSSLAQMIERVMAQRFHQDRDEPHRILAEFPLSTFITTNYDSFMAAALQLAGKKPLREYCHWESNDINDVKANAQYRSLEGTLTRPLVFHLYGRHEMPTSLVLTEDNYLDFLRIVAGDYEYRIPERLHGTVVQSMVLFLGYELDSLHFRVLYRTLVKGLKESKRGRIAVLQIAREENQPSRVEVLLRFMRKYCQNLQIKVYEGSARDFLLELRKHWEKGS